MFRPVEKVLQVLTAHHWKMVPSLDLKTRISNVLWFYFNMQRCRVDAARYFFVILQKTKGSWCKYADFSEFSCHIWF